MLVKDKAQRDAEDVLAAYWASGFPVDPERIARSLGMVVERRALDENISGMLRVEPDAPAEIYVDESDVEPRQRFTIAHEIGHFYERTERGELDFNFIDRRGTADYDVHEFYADEFAGNLLMPRTEVERLVRDALGLAQMSRHFGVSLPAMKLRLRRLGLS